MSERVPYARYRRVFECTARKYAAYQRIFGALSAGLNATLVCLQILAVGLQSMYATDPDDDALRTGSILSKLVVVALTAIRGLLSLEDVAAGCAHASNITRRHLATREPATIATIQRVFDTDTAFLPHPTRSPECKLVGYVEPLSSAPLARAARPPPDALPVATAKSVVAPSRQSIAAAAAAPTPTTVVVRRKPVADEAAAQRADKRLDTTNTAIAYANYEMLLRCAHRKFDRISQLCRILHIALLVLHIACANAIVGLQTLDAAQLRGALVAANALDLALVAALSLPLATTSKRCQHTYVLCCQYLLTRAPLTAAVVETLYDTPTFLFANPLLSETCAKHAEKVRRNPLRDKIEECCDVRVTS